MLRRIATTLLSEESLHSDDPVKPGVARLSASLSSGPQEGEDLVRPDTYPRSKGHKVPPILTR